MYEAEQATVTRHFDLAAHGFAIVERIMPEVTRATRLVVAGKARHTAGDRGPFGKALAPPFVVFRNGVKLRQIIRQQLGLAPHAARQGLEFLEIRPRPTVGAHGGEHAGFGGRWHGMHGQYVADTTVVQQRVFVVRAIKIAALIIARVKPGRWIAAFAITPQQEMLERIDAGGGNIRVCGKVIGRIELRQRADDTAETQLQEMAQQGFAGIGLVQSPIPAQIEKWRRRPPTGFAKTNIVQERIDPAALNVGVFAQIPIRDEIRIGAPAFLHAVLAEMHHRVMPDQIAIRVEIPIPVKQAARRQGDAIGIMIQAERIGDRPSLRTTVQAAHRHFVHETLSGIGPIFRPFRPRKSR